jgi:hypothetical protein
VRAPGPRLFLPERGPANYRQGGDRAGLWPPQLKPTLNHFPSLNLTPGRSPFSSTKVTPADSRAAQMATGGGETAGGAGADSSLRLWRSAAMGNHIAIPCFKRRSQFFFFWAE